LTKTLMPILKTWLCPKERKPKKQTLPNETTCLPKLCLKILMLILGTWADLTRNFLNKKHEPIFEKQKLGK
jgi:H+/gluconate symporter-like permease